MGPVGTLLSLPVAGPVGALAWLARQIAGNAMEQLLDPARIETALRRLERRLESGEIDEATYDAEETSLLEELAEMRALRAEMDEASSSPDGSPDAGSATISDVVPGRMTDTLPGDASRTARAASGDTLRAASGDTLRAASGDTLRAASGDTLRAASGDTQ